MFAEECLNSNFCVFVTFSCIIHPFSKLQTPTVVIIILSRHHQMWLDYHVSRGIFKFLEISLKKKGDDISKAKFISSFTWQDAEIEYRLLGAIKIAWKQWVVSKRLKLFLKKVDAVKFTFISLFCCCYILFDFALDKIVVT